MKLGKNVDTVTSCGMTEGILFILFFSSDIKDWYTKSSILSRILVEKKRKKINILKSTPNLEKTVGHSVRKTTTSIYAKFDTPGVDRVRVKWFPSN